MVSIMHEQNIICSKALIYRQLLAGHMVSSWPMKRKEKIHQMIIIIVNYYCSKETLVLRRWERSKQKFGFIKRVDNGLITTVKDLES